MSAVGHVRFQRQAWIAAGSLTLAGVALGCWLFPEWRMPPTGPQPEAPRIAWSASDKVFLRETLELRAVRSPVLIALAQASALPGAARTPGQVVTPPAGPPPEPTDGLGMPVFFREDARVMEVGSLLRRKDITGVGVFSGIIKSPFFPKEEALVSRAVVLEYAGGLVGKHIVVDDWSWNQWTQADTSWEINLDVESDSHGRMTQVLLDAPADDASLNEALIQALYRWGRVQPAGACRGLVRISFAGTR